MKLNRLLREITNLNSSGACVILIRACQNKISFSNFIIFKTLIQKSEFLIL